MKKHRKVKCMDKLEELIEEKLKELDRHISGAKKSLRRAPEGILKVSNNKKTYQYYCRCNNSDKDGKYITKKNMNLVRGLAQKDYDQKFLAAAQKEKIFFEQIQKKYDSNYLKEIFDNLPESRKDITIPYILDEEEYVSIWESTEYPIKLVIREDDNEIFTEKGEVVRSKSEKIIADRFNVLGIPYHYEKPLYLEGYGSVHPDFTVLNRKTQKEFYWEHFGLMDNPQYCENVVKKLETMSKNGIFPGDNLIMTFETGTHILNMKNVDLLIERYLI